MNRASYDTHMTGSTARTARSELSDGSKEAIRALQQKLENFYKVVDPIKLDDETKVNELVRWARKYSERALVTLMHRKYGILIDDVEASDKGWADIRARLKAYYLRHDRSKPASEVDKIFNFTKQHGLARLNERLVEKYGVPLHSVQPAMDDGAEGAGFGAKKGMGGGFGKFKEKYKHVIAAESQAQLQDEVGAFYGKHDPSKGEEEQQRIVRYAMQNGRKAVNAILLEKYGATLDDVVLVEGATADERKFNLRKRLVAFYAEHDEDNKGTMPDDKLTRLVDWGLTHYEELNEQLSRTYGYNLDSKRVNPDELRLQLFSYFSDKVKVKTGKGELEQLVKLAEAKGFQALDDKLVLQYGKPLEDEHDDHLEHKDLFLQQTPKMSRLSVKSIRRSLSNALRRPSNN